MTAETGLRWVLKCRDWTENQQELIRVLFEDLWHAWQKRTHLRMLMAREVTSDPDMLQLVRLCGLRHITVYALVAFIGDISRFRTPKQLVAYIGLQPRTHLSGQGGKTGPLAHAGRRDLRSLLVQAAQAILRLLPGSYPLARWGRAVACRRGKMIAVIGVARKIAVAVWYLMRGYFTPLLEISETIHTKLEKLAREIGLPVLTTMGFESLRAFVREKETILLSSP